MFTSFIKLPIEIRRAIWSLALPSHQPRQIIFDYKFNGLILAHKPTFFSVILHVCRESRTIALEKCTQLYGTQPLYTDLSKAVIALRKGSLWNILTCGLIFEDEKKSIQNFAIFSDIVLECMIMRSAHGVGDFHMAGGLVNLLGPIIKLAAHTGMERNDKILIVHTTWSQVLADQLDMARIEDIYGSNRGDLQNKFNRVLGYRDVRIEELPRFEHITIQDFDATYGE